MQKFMLPVLFILCLIPCCIEVDMSAPSFPEISSYFGVSERKVELTIAYNFLGFWIAAVLYGPLSECYGRRKIMIIGNTFLLMGAFGCGIVTTIDQLLGWRFIQGIGASAPAVIVFAMIADVYKGNEAIRLIGIMNATLTLVMAIAPIVGSFINYAWGWRGNYFIVAAISLISWILLFKMLPETKKNLQRFNLKRIQNHYKVLLRSPAFICTSFVPSMLYAAYMAFVACGPFLYMETFNLSIFTYACHQGVIIAVFSLVSLFSHNIINIFGEKSCIVLSVTACSISAIGLTLISLFWPHSPFLITSCMIIFCMGFSLCYPIIFSISLDLFPHLKGTASSLTMALRALIVGLTSFLYNGHPFSLFFVILLTTIFVFIVIRGYLLNKIFHHDNTKK